MENQELKDIELLHESELRGGCDSALPCFNRYRFIEGVEKMLYCL